MSYDNFGSECIGAGMNATMKGHACPSISILSFFQKERDKAPTYLLSRTFGILTRGRGTVLFHSTNILEEEQKLPDLSH